MTPKIEQTFSKNWDEGVSVIVPTFRRPAGIETALNSLEHQSAQGRDLEIIVVDNDPNAGAREFVTTYAKKSRQFIQYLHVADPGVSNARNGAMALARGRYIAFLDDDMEALPNWIESLLSTSQKLNAGLVFGPAEAQMPNPSDPRNIHLVPFFSRIAKRADEGYMSETLGTGGCLVDRSITTLPNPPFDVCYNETGGEDDIFFAHLIHNGSKVAWSPKARAYEHVPTKRATDSYIWKRNFAFGQGPIQIALEKGVAGYPKVLWHMGVGILQLLMYAPLCCALKQFNKASYVKYMAKTAQALGKIFWSDDLSPKLYGLSQIHNN